MRIVFLRLEGPLQSWGEHSKWDNRDSSIFPSKSGVIGMIASCMGMQREDTRIEDLHRKLSFSVRADCPGVIETDFHTVTAKRLRTADGKLRARDKSTIISRRQYLNDSAFLAAITSKEDTVLDEVVACLKKPVWSPFLGRKSCIPTSPIFYKDTVQYTDVVDALRQEPLLERADDSQEFILAEIEDNEGELSRQDGLLSTENRRFTSRKVRLISIRKEDLNDVSLSIDA